MPRATSRPTDYLTLGDVLQMHRELMGGVPAPSILLDEGKLESAMQRAENAAYYEEADIFQQAASLTAGIALAHAFEDGNKRLAYAVCLTFLRINGIRVTIPARELADQVLKIVDRDGERRDSVVERFATMLREHSERA